MSDDSSYTVSSGNIFADLEVANPEEAQTKAELARRINSIIERRGLTQVQAGEVLGISQPKVSALARGRLTGFSIERLFRFLVALDSDVEITVKSKAPHRDRGHISVLAE
jgi:predicted XRE-type DNA-binding protein